MVNPDYVESLLQRKQRLLARIAFLEGLPPSTQTVEIAREHNLKVLSRQLTGLEKQLRYATCGQRSL